jgi:thiamine biosynthesis protein ThiS
MIRIKMNGFEEAVCAGTTIKDLISGHGEETADLIVELNNRFVFTEAYISTVLEEGDSVEFIHADFGG